MWTFLKLAVFMLSNFGWWEFFRKKWNIGLYFAPIFTISVQFTVLFFFGLWNCLLYGAVFMYGTGILLAGWQVWKNRAKCFGSYCNWGIGFLVVLTLLAAVLLRNRMFAWQDSYTHWGVVANKILQADRFPNFTDAVIIFQNYPLGAALYIYYFCRLTSSSEGMMMLAQTYMMLCMILPVFGFVKKNRVLAGISAALMTNFLLCYNIPITELLVDTLLGLAGGCTLIFLADQCSAAGEEHAEIRCLLAIPMLCFLSQIKNSAGLFVAAAILVLLWQAKRQPKTDRYSTWALVITILAPLAVMFLWDRHCDFSFADAAASKHALSGDWMQMAYSEKTHADIVIILQRVVNYMVTRREAWGLLAFAAFLEIVWGVGKRPWKGYGKRLGLAAALYAAYTVGLMGMYVFSMPRPAALDVECIDRYAKTVDIAIYVLLFVWLLESLSCINRRQIAAGASGVLILLSAVLWKDQLNLRCFWNLEAPSQIRMMANEMIDQYGVEKGYSYMLCRRGDQYDHPYFIMRYLMDSDDVKNVIVDAESDMAQEKSCDYILIFDENNPIIEQWVQRKFPEQAGERVIYSIKNAQKG